MKRFAILLTYRYTDLRSFKLPSYFRYTLKGKSMTYEKSHKNHSFASRRDIQKIKAKKFPSEFLNVQIFI